LTYQYHCGVLCVVGNDGVVMIEGLLPLMAREASAVGIYFCQYEYMKDVFHGRLPDSASSFAPGEYYYYYYYFHNYHYFQ